MATEPKDVVTKADKPQILKEETIEAELTTGIVANNENDYYTLEELDQLEDQSMAYLAGRIIISDFEGIPSTSSDHQLAGFRMVNQLPDPAQGMVTRHGRLIVARLDATTAMS